MVHRRALDRLGHQPGAARAGLRPGPGRLAQLLVVLEDLPFEQRTALMLREGARLERDEVAYVLDLSASRARQVLVDARVALADARERCGRQQSTRRFDVLRRRRRR